MRILDAGHRYGLLSLDGDTGVTLQFVKRSDFSNPESYPGNQSSYPGTTLQDVIRACSDRVRYLDSQKPCWQNEAILQNLRQCLLLLEARHSEHKGREFTGSEDAAEFGPMCPTCGHVLCPDHLGVTK